jgi:hydrogenase maturation protease
MIAGTVVIGLGNPSRRDDGVGWVVAEAVGRRLGDRLHVRLGDGEPARLLDAWGGARLAVVIDAMRSGAEPGSIRVFEPAEGSAPAPVPALSSHAAGIAYALALGRTLEHLPGKLVVVGIEAGDTDVGEGLSPRVAAAVGSTVDLVAQLVGLPAAVTVAPRSP